MAVTVDCGEGKHQLCVGRGRTAYLFPQESKDAGEEPFYCGCGCHHDGTEGCVPCSDPVHAASQPASPPGEGTPADDIEHDEGGSGCCARGFCGPERQARFAPGEGTR